MTTKQENKANGRFLSMGLLLGAVVILALTVGLGARTWQAWQQPEPMDVNAVEANRVDVLEDVLADEKEAAESLTKKNFLVSEPPKQNPIHSVSGCIGNEAIINGKNYKVGDKVGDAEILAIEATHIKIRWDGKEQIMAPIASNGEGGGRSGPPSRPGGAGRPPMLSRDTGWRRQGPSAEEIAQMKERKKELMQQTKNMSREERQEFMKQQRAR